jgi:archaeosortase A (PGF-CTERM-specific)
MILKSILPFIAVLLFLLALLFRNRFFSERKRLQKEPDSFSPRSTLGKIAGASGWLCIAGYCYFEAAGYFTQEEYFDASLALLFLAFALLFALLMSKSTVSEKREENLLFTITKVALITAVFYFPFAEISFLGDYLIFITAKITTATLNLFHGGVTMVPPASIYTTDSSFHVDNTPVEIILACTAIQSMVLFTGLIFAVNAPMRSKLKAFIVSVPVIYGLNIARNVLVAAAYFGAWFGAPLESFEFAHGVLARIGAMIALIVIAYAVFVILPETLDLVEEFFHFIMSTIRRTN